MEGVQCNNETGHVQMLHLRGHYPQYLKGAVDLTSLIALQNIQHLDLSNNDFRASHIPKLISSSSHLRYLNLSYSSFGGMIPYELGNLSQLEYLDLSNNYLFHGEIPSHLGNLTSLRYLDLSSNFDIIGEIPLQLGNLSQLRYLGLWQTSLSGIIPFQVGNLPFLHGLSLTGNFNLNSAKWLSSLSSLTTLSLSSFHNYDPAHQWLHMISEHIPKLRELRLVDSSLSDNNISSLFPLHSNFSNSLSILDLSGNMLTSSTLQMLFNYSLNLQELYLSHNNIVLSSRHYLNIPSLVTLDLSSNNMSPFQGNFKLNSKLQELYLSNCDLTDRNFLVPSASIKNSSSSLVTLDLSYNILKSSAVLLWIFNFTSDLSFLSLSENLLEGPIPDEFVKVMNFIEVLSLGSNKIQGEIPASIGNICTLHELNLGGNNLIGEISSFIQNSSWCNRHVFQSLDLSHNRINGMLPNLSIFTSLKSLDLSNNQLTGEIPKSIGLLHELESLHLEGNHLEGDITELHLTNLFKLEELDFTDNSLSLKFGPTWIPPFQLTCLGLASCKMGPRFPSWLQTQSHLSFLDISDAGIDDIVPKSFWNKLQSISRINMSYNSLRGTIPNLPIELRRSIPNLPTSFVDDDTFIILNSNQLEGEIPAFLLQAQSLDLSKNMISGLNTFLCGKGPTTNLWTLDLSNNQIMGQLPDCWEHLRSLGYLDLSNNKLSGNIPLSIGTLVNLEALVLGNNNLIGDLPLTLMNSTSLVILDVSDNLLSGPIPSWVGESLLNLKILSLRVNSFSGNVPVHLCYLKQIHLLDLSRNHLSGEIPSCLSNFTAMKQRGVITGDIKRGRKIASMETYINIYVSDVLLLWKGQDYEIFYPEFLLSSIDLSSNGLSGEIPKEVGYLLGLVSLNLSRNNLKGEIPYEIGNLNSMDFLDLSRNHLSGNIPSTLSKIDRLAVLDLSNNDLNGRIPWGRQLQTFDGSSFEGNVGLCGQQLNKSCPGDETTPQPQGQATDGDDNSVFYEGLYMSLGLGFFIGFWGLLGPILLWKPWRIAYLRVLSRLTDYILVTAEVTAVKCHRWLKG